MTDKPRYRLTTKDKLKSRKVIDLLFREGKTFSYFPFRVIYQLDTTSGKYNLQAGFTVSSRNFKRAVDRNRIKRLVREAYRLQKAGLEQTAASLNCGIRFFFVYTGNELPGYELISAKTAGVLKRLQKIVHETVAPHT